jgi:hypothetical protein
MKLNLKFNIMNIGQLSGRPVFFYSIALYQANPVIPNCDTNVI